MHSMTAIYIVIAILTIYFLSNWNVASYEDYLYGFWTADGDEEADIESMMLFIGDPERGWIKTTRTCYLVIMNDICNQGFSMEYTRGWGSSGINRYVIKPTITFDESSYWPENVIVEVDIRNGTMIIHKDGVTYARLHKQNDTTNHARALSLEQLND